MIYLNQKLFKSKVLKFKISKMKKWLNAVGLCFSLILHCSFSFALELGSQSFTYETSDGGFHLNCDYSENKKLFNDYDVICGKGSPVVKEYRVHLLLREHLQKQADKKIIEIIYSVHDLNKGLSLNSMNQLLEFDINSQFKKISMGLALENDSAFLNLKGEVQSK